MKAILKPTKEIVYVTYDKESNLYYDTNKSYIKYSPNDIEEYNHETETKIRMINKVLSEFDFAKVRRCMELLGWKYWFTKDIPSFDVLKDTAKELLNDVYGAKDYKTLSTGGFRAEYFPELEHGTLQLSFIIEEYDVSNSI